MENNQQNLWLQMQNLLNQLSNYIYNINDIILQMNNIINQINNPMINSINNQLNQFNNSMKMINNNQMNFNINNNIQFPNQLNNEILNNNSPINCINIGFKYNHTGGSPENILFVNKNLTINELLNLYLKRINKLEYINKYDNYYRFLYNSLNLNICKDKTIGEINIEDRSAITVLVTRELIGCFNH